MKNSKNPLLWASLMLASAGIAFSASAADVVRAELNLPVVASAKASLAGVKLVEAPYRAAKVVAASAKENRSAVVRAAVEAVLTQHPTAVGATVRAVLTVAPDESVAVMSAVMSKAPKAYRVAMIVISEISPSSVQQVASMVSSERPEIAADVQKMVQMASPAQSPSNKLSAVVPRFGVFYFSNPVVDFTEVIFNFQANPPGEPNPNQPIIRILESCYGPS